MICSICKKEMSISEGLTEMDSKKCHVSCKEKWKQRWRQSKNIDHIL